MKKINILVFPCGSEVALEIFQSLRYSTHINLIGASSVDDHGKYVFGNYIGNVPFVSDVDFIYHMRDIVKKYNIDAIYPAMDAVALALKDNEKILSCKIITSPTSTNKICISKGITYNVMKCIVPVPEIYNSTEGAVYPLFIKPDRGYGSRNNFTAINKLQADIFLEKHADDGDFILCELLVGDEYTIDCFTDRHGELRYSKARRRNRVSNGISVNTLHDSRYDEIFTSYAYKINSILKFRGAWFFQMKEDKERNFKLLEIATRLAGSSGICRMKGINFSLLSVFDFFEHDVYLIENDYTLIMDRALSSKYKISYDFEHVYVDLDDCIIIDNKVNTTLVSFLFLAINKGIKVHLLTKHQYDLEETLIKYRLSALFDFVYRINKGERKSNYIKNKNAIFIDDSFEERKDVFCSCDIPVFSPDMVDALL